MADQFRDLSLRIEDSSMATSLRPGETGWLMQQSFYHLREGLAGLFGLGAL
jgi:hypothetical protein